MAQAGRKTVNSSAAPRASPGMYFDPASELLLPQGVRLASRRQVAAAWVLGLVLFSITLGIGYITWSLFAWRKGRSPAQRILSLRCWLPKSRQVAGRGGDGAAPDYRLLPEWTATIRVLYLADQQDPTVSRRLARRHGYPSRPGRNSGVIPCAP